ncbi:peptidoglycan-binding protein [Nonomuraea helvata]|uniref:Peptidoglycan-binding protein n=1 Tax=Nonomuraea helvata TaxID=37484 RepID=A0ABV5S5Y8_9ACTN
MAIDLVLRRDWNARAPRGDYTQLDSTKGVKVHYTGGTVDPGIVHDHNGCVALVRSIQAYHMDGNGWIDIGYCVDEETEILTRQGWKSYQELRVEDIALTLNHDTGMSEWQPVLEVCVFPAMEREMIRMEGVCHSSLTTPHHRWPVERYRRRTGTERQKGPNGKWLPTGKAKRTVTSYERLWVTTETIGYWDRVPIAASCADLPTELKWSDAFVELVAWFWTEGHIKRTRQGAQSGVAIYQSLRNQSYLMRIRTALHKVFGPPVDRFPRRGRTTDGTPLWREAINDDLVEFHLSVDAGRQLIDVAPGRVPGFEFLLSLSQAQLALFIETSLAADNAGFDLLAQKDRAAAEAFMFAVLLSGSGASLRRIPPRGTTKTDMWLVTIRRQQYFMPRSAAQRRNANFTIQKEMYHGQIWCPRTENQSWLARRKGTVYFTGNTMIACPHRKVFEGRGLHHLPAANGAGLNSGHYAVLGLVGNSGLVLPPDGVLHGILDAIQYLRDRGSAGKEIKGHRDGYSTDCPGEPLYAWVRRGAPRPGGGTEPGPVAPPFPGRLLTYPPVTQGDDVRAWQAQMKRRGWVLTVDGAYGAESRDVCRRFQRQQGVTDDGIVGPVTWRLAWEAPAA